MLNNMKRFYTFRLLGLIAWIGIVGLTSCVDKQNDRDAQMSRFVDDLMSRMTLEEKLGQLNLPVAGDIVTGAARESNVAENIRQGRVGGLFNLKGAAQIREIQRIAVEESRLGYLSSSEWMSFMATRQSSRFRSLSPAHGIWKLSNVRHK